MLPVTQFFNTHAWLQQLLSRPKSVKWCAWINTPQVQSTLRIEMQEERRSPAELLVSRLPV